MPHTVCVRFKLEVCIYLHSVCILCECTQMMQITTDRMLSPTEIRNISKHTGEKGEYQKFLLTDKYITHQCGRQTEYYDQNISNS